MTVVNTLCPACGRKAFGLMVKLMLGPAGAVPCPQCGESIGVSIWPHLAGVTAFVAYVVSTAIPGSPMTDGRFAGALLAAIVLVCGLWFLQAPLVRKKGD
jgi:hypothetical protein